VTKARLAVAFALAAVVASGQDRIEGTLVNGTVGGPARVEQVALVSLSQGLNQVAALTDVDGSFTFELDAPGPYLVRATYHGVSYTTRIPAVGAVARPEIKVYEVTEATVDMQVAVPHLVIIVDGPKVHVARVFEITNTSQPPYAIVGKPGAFRFDLPEDADVTRATLTSSSMPLVMEPVETYDDIGQTIAQTIKPGLTRYEIDYELPYAGSIELSEKLFHGATSIDAIVLPADIEVEVTGLEALGKTEREGVSFLSFAGAAIAPGSVLRFAVRGEARAPRPPGAPEGADASTCCSARRSPSPGSVWRWRSRHRPRPRAGDASRRRRPRCSTRSPLWTTSWLRVRSRPTRIATSGRR